MAGDVDQWLEALDLAKYREAFAENEIAFSDLSQLTDDDLKEMGLPIGPRRRVLKAIVEPNAGHPVRTDGQPADMGKDGEPGPSAERRQVTVMFCDLVGSTALSRCLDPEDLREMMRRYQDAVAGAVTRFGGHVAKYLGDGVLAYFGWPQAHEDQVERAVRSGFTAIEAIGQIGSIDGESLQARVGIATGEVVVGDLLGELGRDAEAIAGETPNLASRLQGLAAPNQIVVGPTTQRLIGPIFELADLGAHSLKGFDQPTQAWQVIAERQQESRFEARRADSDVEIVGRYREIDMLLDRWQAAQQGNGQAVLISGEPGIGKSRIVAAVRDRLEGSQSPANWLTFQCVPFHTATPLHPFVAWLMAAADLSPDDIDHGRIEKLAVVLPTGAENAEAIALLGDALGFRVDLLPALDLEPSRRRVRTMEVIVEQILASAHNVPPVIVLEDAHWADPTSLDTLDILIDRIGNAPVFILVTHRPEFTAAWQDHPHVLSLRLTRLNRDDVERLVARLTGNIALPATVMAAIVDRTDGVPLFIEEVTAALLEAHSGTEFADSDVTTIPQTLQSLLHARLDRLGDAKPVAQVAAVIGRTFDEAMLDEVLQTDGDNLSMQLNRLVESGLVLRRGSVPGRYMFKHALIQDAAYGSLLRDRRRDLHQRLGEALERRAGQDKGIEPALLAHHFQQAGDTERAKSYWRHGLDRALERTAEHEALDCAVSLTELLRDRSDGDGAAREEMEMQLLIGWLHYAVSGMGTPSAREPLERARELARSLEDHRAIVLAQLPLAWSAMSSNFGISDTIAMQENALATATHHQLRDVLPHCRGLLAWSVYVGGDYGKSLELSVEALQQETIELEPHYMILDPRAMAMHYRGLHLSMLGYPDQGLKHHLAAVESTPKFPHPHSRTAGYVIAAAFRSYRREAEACLEMAYAAIRESEEHRYAYMRPHAELYEAWALTLMGRGAERRDFLKSGIDGLEKNETRLFLELLTYVLADGLLQDGEVDEALAALEIGFDNIAITGADCWRPELHRLNAEALRVAGAAVDDVEQEFARATASARKQQSKLLELRVACGLARFRMGLDADATALEALQPIYGWFTEGFGTPDLRDATALMEHLG